MKTPRYSICLLFTLTLTAFFQASTLFSQTAPLHKKGLCAHRGDQGVAPESTIPAFVAAVKSGAQQVEFDVQKTSDGKLVVIHDLWVDRTTTGKGFVKDLTELNSIPVLPGQKFRH